jgi:SanA protein
MMILRRALRILFYSSLLIFVIGFYCSAIISDSTSRFLSNDIGALPACKTALVLGTSPHLSSGLENPYFAYRIEAAERLVRTGKVSMLILSGDNRVNDYNEPKRMRAELLKRGVPDSCMVLDYAGLRTFDSMIRCREVFGQDSVIVVSQEFHNARAVFIGRKNGIAAFGFNARNVTPQQSYKTVFREFFSRIKCVLDIYVLGTKPKHLGEKIRID